jgi:hypothetical protein
VQGTAAVSNAGLTELAAAINASSQMDVNIAANGIGLATSAKQDTIITAVQLIDDTVFTDDAAFTPTTSKGIAVGFQADDTSTDSVDEGDFGVARMTLDRQLRVVPGVATTAGATTFRSIDIDETEEEVKATPGLLYGYMLSNLSSGTRFFKFYNLTAANTTVGSSTPVMTIPLKADQAANVWFASGVTFDTAITVAATTGIADADTGAPGANECVCNIFYK